MKKLFIIVMMALISSSAFAGKLKRKEIKDIAKCLGATEVLGQYMNYLLEQNFVTQQVRDDIFDYNEGVWFKGKELLENVSPKKYKRYDKFRIRIKESFAKQLKEKGTEVMVNDYMAFSKKCDVFFSHKLEQMQ